ncbi:phasin family protein [Ancylobacter radicis]|uniref:Phasin family protein n=1 Tax=Ancylobacter radicis TaxID=2836179 RepID=A0ABS5RD38_9HYPH|nr:phasin family protein [Ancylobacter radicis]MBS9478754.1 phasin family protein [Ancylobacter radicis]
MANGPKLEVPPELRNIAEQGVDQARAAMDGFINAAHKALDDAGRQVDVAHDSARDLGRTTLRFAEDNIAAGFDFAARLARASTVEEWSRLQADYVKVQAERLTAQAKELGVHITMPVAPVPPAGKPGPKPPGSKAS